MPSRTLMVDGQTWQVYPSGLITQYNTDEFGLLFVRGSEGETETRVTRYSPRGAVSREASLAEFTDTDLRTLFAQSQPSNTSPEAGYHT
jgi:hypothetical protein